MPKRKASESSAPAAASGAPAITSPNPRKKSKKEALAAAKQWHDKRVSGVGVVTQQADQSVSTSVSATRGEGKKSKQESLAAAKKWHDKRVSGVGADKAKSSTQKVSAQSSLHEDAPKRSGGNSFLQSLRKQASSSSSAAGNEKVKEEPLNGKASSVKESTSKITSTDKVDSTTTKDKRKAGAISFVEIILIILFLAMNIATSLYIFEQQSVTQNMHQEFTSEVENIKNELAKSQRVERILQSSIKVLEQKQLKNTVVRDMEEVHSLYQFNGSQNDAEGKLQSREEKEHWTEVMRNHVVEKNSALSDFHSKLNQVV